MKYIFFIIAILVQPFFTYYVYHKQDKNQAALKVPMVAYSAVYLVAQFYVYFKYLLRIPEDYQIFSYLIQAAILVVFIAVEFSLFFSNKHINRVESEKAESISDFTRIKQLFEIENAKMSSEKKTPIYLEISDLIKYANPVNRGEVDEEDRKLEELIGGISELSTTDLEQRCKEIKQVLDIRKIKQKGTK